MTQLIDYIYVSFTNSIAFSPTDAMPLTRWAKLLMLSESAISSITILLVAARSTSSSSAPLAALHQTSRPSAAPRDWDVKRPNDCQGAPALAVGSDWSKVPAWQSD